MAVSTIDPRTALVIIDLQKGFVDSYREEGVDAVVHQAVTLAAGFRRQGLPVFLVNVVGRAPGRTEVSRSGGSRQLSPGSGIWASPRSCWPASPPAPASSPPRAPLSITAITSCSPSTR